MPRKSKIEQLPKDIRIVQFAPGELKPLVVKASDIGKVIIGLSAMLKVKGVQCFCFLISRS